MLISSFACARRAAGWASYVNRWASTVSTRSVGRCATPTGTHQFALRPSWPPEGELRGAPPYVYDGYLGRIRRARLNLAYALLRRQKGVEAVRAVMPSVRRPPHAAGIRDVASIAWGVLR